MVRCCPVDISPATISRFLYGPTTGHSWSLNTSEFDYRWDIVRSGTFQRNAEQREAVLLWLASSSRSTPQLGAIVVPLARVHKLEAQLATLLHHIQPWMQKSIAESEARMERRMEGIMDGKADLASLRTDVDAILAAPSVETQAAPTTLDDDTVLDALFSGTAEEGPAPTHAKGKQHHSHRMEEEKAYKRQRRQEKEARRA
uniref:Integrase core domain containing protein n=1 Tax=Solanum tuberosum TaxID=4113 RepID=M1DGP2_SOLTU